MSPRTTGVLALIAVALGAFIYVYEIEGSATREAESAEALEIHPGLVADEIDAVGLTTLDGVEVRFEREDGRWRVVSPIEARADATALDAITNALANLPREGSVSGADSLDDFGLGDSAAAVLFEVGDRVLGLRIGKTTPVGGHRYVVPLSPAEPGDAATSAAADPNQIAYVTSYRVNAFNRNFDDLRDRRPFTFEAGDVRTLRISWPADTDSGEFEIALARDAAGDWQMGSPRVGRADSEQVREVLSNLAYLRASQFISPEALEPDAADAAALREALARTAIRFHVTLDGDHLERAARISGMSGDQLLFEAPDGQVYGIAPERLEDFPRSLIAYRFKQLADFEVSAARRLEMEFAEEASNESRAPLRVIAALEDAGWSSPSVAIDPDQFSSLVRLLASLEATEIVADEMGPRELASLGLEPPRARIRVEGPAAGDPEPEAVQVLADLVIGRLDASRGLFMMRADEETVFLLETGLAEALPTSADALRRDFMVGEGDEQAENAADPGLGTPIDDPDAGE